ncbi:unnamed protein product, partial [Mesorhabditis spiculigera]
MLGRALIIFALAGLSAAVCPRRSIPEGRYCRFSLGVKLPIIEAMTACENLDAKYAVPANDTNTIIRAVEYKKVVVQHRDFWVRTIPGLVEVVCRGIAEKHQICASWGEITDMEETDRRRLRSDGQCPPCPRGDNKDKKTRISLPMNAGMDGKKVFATKTCHKLLDGQAFWKAEKECVGLGGHLAPIRSADDQLIMIGKQKKWSPRHAIWIGGVQVDEPQRRNGFHWLDPAAGNITYSHYGLNEPAGARFCLFFGTHGFWGSEACSDVQQAFCQRPLGPPKVLADPKCEDGWIPCKQSQRCYKADAVAMDYVTAREHCLQQGADLATIHSFWENEAVIEAAAAVNSDKAWLGKRRNGDQWQWVNNEPHDFSIWHAGDVNTYIGDCAIVFGAVEATALAWLHRWDNVHIKSARAGVRSPIWMKPINVVFGAMGNVRHVPQAMHKQSPK